MTPWQSAPNDACPPVLWMVGQFDVPLPSSPRCSCFGKRNMGTWDMFGAVQQSRSSTVCARPQETHEQPGSASSSVPAPSAVRDPKSGGSDLHPRHRVAWPTQYVRGCAISLG